MRFLALFLCCFFCACITNRTPTVNNDPCLSTCDAAGDETKNTTLIHQQMEDEAKMADLMADTSIYLFPLRIGIVELDIDQPKTLEKDVQSTIDILNLAFRNADIQFYIAKVDYIESPLNISLLQRNAYEAYDAFSDHYDLQDTISLYFFDYDPDLCEVNGNTISCGRTGGFSYILSQRTNNVVLSKFDIGDFKIIVHEFGHFFGLYHTFEEHPFGKEAIAREGCENTGDRICDTPADPGTLYEVYVNYSTCEMIGYQDPGSKQFYTPLIDNYMSYYKPCYLREFSFTPMQLAEIKVASRSELRANFRQQ